MPVLYKNQMMKVYVEDKIEQKYTKNFEIYKKIYYNSTKDSTFNMEDSYE